MDSHSKKGFLLHDIYGGNILSNDYIQTLKYKLNYEPNKNQTSFY